MLIAAAGLFWAGPTRAEETTPTLKVYLPRTARVSGKGMRLGGLAIIRGSDEKTVAKASNTPMGRKPWSREKMIIDRRTILSQLVAGGIPAKCVQFTGAEQIIVTCREKVFDSKRLVEVAEAFINKTRPAPKECQWRVLRTPEALLADGGGDIQLKPRIGKQLSSGCVSVEITAVIGDTEVGVSRVLFKQLFQVRQLVALRNIPSGGVITTDNTKVTVVTSLRKGTEWKSPVRLQVKRQF